MMTVFRRGHSQPATTPTSTTVMHPLTLYGGSRDRRHADGGDHGRLRIPASASFDHGSLPTDEVSRVNLPKKDIIDLFVARGDLDRAERADRSLPDMVDLSAHSDAVRALGLDPALLATQIDNLEAN